MADARAVIEPGDAVDIVNGVPVLRHRGRCASDCFCGAVTPAPRPGRWRRFATWLDSLAEASVPEKDPRPYG